MLALWFESPLRLYETSPTTSARALSAQDNPLKIYDRVYIHPNEPVSSDSSRDEQGIVEVIHQDGTVEKVFADVWNARLRRGDSAWSAFGDRPSSETFAALDDFQKRRAVKAILFSSDEQEEPVYGAAKRKLSEAYMASLTKGDQDRILYHAFNDSLDILGGDPSESDHTIKIFRELTRGQNLKMRDVICPQLYSLNLGFEQRFAEPFVQLLDKMTETKGAMELTCPTKDNGTFKIGDQVAKVREQIYVDPDAKTKSHVQAAPQLRLLAAVKCSKDDFLSELKDVEQDFFRSPGPHSNWFRRSVGECRFQGSVKKIANGKFEFQLQAALPGEAKVAPLPFKDFDELKVKLNLAEQKSQAKPATSSAVMEVRSARVAK